MLYFLAWKRAASMLVDVKDEAAARAAGKEEEGSEPDEVKPFPPNTFALYVEWDEDEDDADSELLALDAPPHVTDLLAKLEDECAPDEAATCGAEADGEGGEVLRCELRAGHTPTLKHRNGAQVWA